jgi:hypothetical protein
MRFHLVAILSRESILGLDLPRCPLWVLGEFEAHHMAELLEGREPEVLATHELTEGRLRNPGLFGQVVLGQSGCPNGLPESLGKIHHITARQEDFRAVLKVNGCAGPGLRSFACHQQIISERRLTSVISEL